MNHSLRHARRATRLSTGALPARRFYPPAVEEGKKLKAESDARDATAAAEKAKVKATAEAAAVKEKAAAAAAKAAEAKAAAAKK